MGRAQMLGVKGALITLHEAADGLDHLPLQRCVQPSWSSSPALFLCRAGDRPHTSTRQTWISSASRVVEGWSTRSVPILHVSE
jgi:hypothetical protein